jgi:membrane peptidoglycan carboxypeptidase
VLDPLFATRMVNMLKGVIAFGTGTGAQIGRPEAGKTGTSQDWRDAWFVGFTPDVLTAVWVGNDDGAPMAKVTGGELPAAIWKKYMLVAEKALPPRDFPWLTAEPATAPQTEVADQQTPYEDEPSQMGGGDEDQPPAMADVDPRADDADDPGGDNPIPPPRAYARRGPGDGADPYAGGADPAPAADPYDRPRQRGAYDAGPPDDDQGPPPRWRGPPPGSGGGGGGDASGPPPYERAPPPAPDSPADDAPRYRY